MSSIREQILVSLTTLLSGAGAPAGLNIFRERYHPIEAGSLPAILVYAADDDPRGFDGTTYKPPLIERQLTLRIECRALGNTETPADVALDPIVVWATKTIMANETFGGLANEVVEGRSEYQSVEGDLAVSAVAILFTVKYRTSRLDPTLRT